jgi:RNA-directed DNA polymerase
VISPLLANIYLNPLDRAFERSGIGKMKAGTIRLVRYADDMLIVAQRDLDKGVELLGHYLERLGLKLNQKKTRRLDLKVDKKVEFLGFEFHRVINKKTKKRLILLSPSPGSQKKCRERVRKLINHNIPVRVKDQIENVNQFLMGWTNYFRLGNSGKALKTLN